MEGAADITLSGNLILVVALLGALPLILVAVTSFIKLAIVMSLVRNALGVQQVPPNIVLYGLSLLLTVYIMLPVGLETVQIVQAAIEDGRAPVDYLADAVEPLRLFLSRNAAPNQVEFFKETIDELWKEDLDIHNNITDLIIVMPAFATSELTRAFEIGFLAYLPFIAIDLVISNILLALGMMMLSPVTISLPFKIFLFVAVDGWTRLIQALVLTYQ